MKGANYLNPQRFTEPKELQQLPTCLLHTVLTLSGLMLPVTCGGLEVITSLQAGIMMPGISYSNEPVDVDEREPT